MNWREELKFASVANILEAVKSGVLDVADADEEVTRRIRATRAVQDQDAADRRLDIAAMAMQGILANLYGDFKIGRDRFEIANRALAEADALIEAAAQQR